MEIKNNKKVILTGKKICLVVGILAGICGIYWLVRALFYDDNELAPMLSSFAIALFLILFAQKR
ncbi:MAG: hypothetical protein J6J20_09805 [Muribaculaceae bacterium]|nr:hypothetical protein [Muribaculaceae bacterium]